MRLERSLLHESAKSYLFLPYNYNRSKSRALSKLILAAFLLGWRQVSSLTRLYPSIRAVYESTNPSNRPTYAIPLIVNSTSSVYYCSSQAIYTIKRSFLQLAYSRKAPGIAEHLRARLTPTTSLLIWPFHSNFYFLANLSYDPPITLFSYTSSFFTTHLPSFNLQP